MTRNYKFAAAALLMAIPVACSPSADTKVPATKAEVAQSAQAGAPLPEGLSECSTLAYSDPVVGDSVTKTCGIALSGLDQGSSFKVELSTGKVTEAGTLGEDSSIRVTRMVGVDAQQVMEETGVKSLAPPEYKDINGDSEADLLILRALGNVYPTNAVWMGSPDGAPYVRAGEVTGEFGSSTADGLLPVMARSEPWSVGVIFYKYGEQQLTLVGSVSVTATEPKDNGPVTDKKCELDDSSGLAAAGLSAEQAKVKFCATPLVAELFK